MRRVYVVVLAVLVGCAAVVLLVVAVSKAGGPWRLVLEIEPSRPDDEGGRLGMVDAFSQISPDGEKVLVSRFDYTVEIWDVASRSRLHVLKLEASQPPVLRGETFCLRWSPNGQMVCVRSGAGRIEVWSAANGRRLWRSDDDFGRAAFSPDSSKVALVPWHPDSVRIVSAASGELVHEFDLGSCNSGWRDLGWSPDDRYFTLCDPFTWWVWDAETGTECIRYRHLDCRKPPPLLSSPDDSGSMAEEPYWGTYAAVQFLPDSKTVVAFYAGYNGFAWPGGMGLPEPGDVEAASRMASMNRVRAYDAATGQIVWDRALKTRLLCGACSADGRYVATGESDGYLRVRELATWTVLHEIEATAYGGGLGEIVWLPDGSGLLAVDDWMHNGRNRLRYFDLASEGPGRVLWAHEDWIEDVSVSDDGRRVLATGADMTHRVWERRGR